MLYSDAKLMYNALYAEGFTDSEMEMLEIRGLYTFILRPRLDSRWTIYVSWYLGETILAYWYPRDRENEPPAVRHDWFLSPRALRESIIM